MPYNPTQHASLPYVDKPYKTLLDKLCVAHKRGLKDEMEYLIEVAANIEGIK